MSWLAYSCLLVLHFLYSIFTFIRAFLDNFRDIPHPLSHPRSQIPSHLALVLVPDDDTDHETAEDCLIESVERAAEWARKVGIRRLTVYDRLGMLSRSAQHIRNKLSIPAKTVVPDSSESELEYPLTPPLSDEADSRPVSPEYEARDVNLAVTTVCLPDPQRLKTAPKKSSVKRRNQKKITSEQSPPLTLHFLSRGSSKPALASIARSHLRTQSRYPTTSQSLDNFHLSQQELNSTLEGEQGFPSPDLLIVHRISPAKHNQIPLELHGFPPWQIRLTEFHHEPPTSPWNWSWLRTSSDPICTPLDEVEFRRALDEYNRAEMRLGK
ncbi:hypothetical protein JAAARDRAFT_29624 [Jaapia argillacea MUCL 33604]|uniref:ditrans,polycis-polyprenyl diphosphate synthase [(2E,6E)-farnesyldiphosphate specific] n=1 Tax=Jaapia argillacea MUCL 33604 TaxID=933084 RepID=A0A067QLT4_9AGAM|nr:hypothetical protein JAAARDRAFT_29624 [Jaapia argillacea MUCL 33604]